MRPLAGAMKRFRLPLPRRRQEHHPIDPPFQEATVHDADKICLLCPSCHTQCHRGMLSAASVAAKYQETRRAPAAQASPPAGPLDHHDGTAQLLLGGLRYSPAVRVLLRHHGTLLITVTPGTGGRPGAINAVFTGDAGRSRSRACLQWKSSSR